MAFHCASASVSSDALEIDHRVCCVIAVGRVPTSLSPRHRSRNDDMIGSIWMLEIVFIETTRRVDMMAKG